MTYNRVMISPATVAHVAQLANLEVSAQEQQQLAESFSATLDEIAKLGELDTKSVEPTHHVTGLENVWREDVVDSERLIPQDRALAQAAHSLRGYVVVDRVLED